MRSRAGMGRKEGKHNVVIDSVYFDIRFCSGAGGAGRMLFGAQRRGEYRSGRFYMYDKILFKTDR